MATYTIDLTDEQRYVVAEALQALAHCLANGLAIPHPARPLQTIEVQSILAMLESPRVKMRTPIADALASIAAGNAYSETSLREAERLVAMLLHRVGDAGTAIVRTLAGEPRTGHALGDAAVLLAAVEPLYSKVPA